MVCRMLCLFADRHLSRAACCFVSRTDGEAHTTGSALRSSVLFLSAVPDGPPACVVRNHGRAQAGRCRARVARVARSR